MAAEAAAEGASSNAEIIMRSAEIIRLYTLHTNIYLLIMEKSRSVFLHSALLFATERSLICLYLP